MVRCVCRECGEPEILLCGGDPAFWLVVRERLPFELIAARLRDGGDDRARGVIVLRAVILGDDAELLHRALREWIAAARVLSGRAALQDIVFRADAVDEDVGLLGVLRVAGKRLAQWIVRQADSWRECGEIQKVAVV